MKFRQHIPAFAYTPGVDDPPPEFEFNTLDELLNHKIVQRYKDKGFSHFAKSENTLMAIYDDGFRWWVVGFVSDPAALDLPQWGGWKFHAELPDGSKVTLGEGDVMMSCGDELTLKDGTKARNLRR